MATREKKPRSVNSDSPTPSLGGGSDSAPSTPTSKSKGATNNNSGNSGGSNASNTGSRASLSRQKSKQLLQNAASEDTVQSADTTDVTDLPSRTTRATKDDSGEQSSKDKSSDPKDSPKDTKPAAARKAAVAGKKKPIKGGASKAKTTITALKKTTLIKRKTRPIVGKPVLGKKVLARKQINAKGKKEVTVTVKEEDNKNTSLRNGKPRATDSPVSQKSTSSRKSAVVTPKDKSPKEPASTPEPATPVKVERRRSDSVSKCSDVTDASSSMLESKADDDDKKDDTSLSEIKREIMEEQETKSKILDKMAETFNEQKTPVAAVIAAKDEKTVRRSARQRKSTARDRDDFVTPKLKVPAEIKAEPMDTDEVVATATPLSIDTDHTAKDVSQPSSGELEKDASLSPELVSEGVSEISVKEFYSEPAFLENNLGIEKDPKLGEIVQVQEKIKLGSGESVVTTANGSESASDKVEPVVVYKEEKMEVVVGEEEVKDDTVKPSEPVEVEKVKDIVAVATAVAAAKEENSGNESPASDWSNEKDVSQSASGKVKKNDSRSDSDGERPPTKQNTPRAATATAAKGTAATATCKDQQKPKTRNVKDKSKEDEKAKEEKLRQEKLRVEEKVREEKLRAERLKQEEDKKLGKALPEGGEITPEVDAKKAPASPTADTVVVGKQELPKAVDEVVSVVEKILPPVTVTTTLSLTSADSHLVLSVKSTESIDIVEKSKSDVAKLNAIALENLPAITLVKKDAAKDDTSKLDNVQLKAELEIVPIKEPTALAIVEEKVVEKDSETTLHIISKSENAAAAVTVTTVAASESLSAAPLSIIKIQTDNDSTNSTIFKENPVEKLQVKASDAVKNRDSIVKVPPVNETKTVPAPVVLRGVPAEVLPASSSSASSSAVVLEESEDIAKQKESHLKHLGLLTHQAASEEKQRRKELVLQKPSGGGGSGSGSGYSSSSSSGKGSGGGGGGGKSGRNSESTGTLKTVIKLNRGEKRKRLPLKMTLQKGKGKGAEKDANGGDGNGDAFYIIQNENDHQNQSMTDSTGAASQQGSRKGHHRSHTTDGVNLAEVVAETAVKEVQKALVIPEKASSFNVHPERLCMDQCFYCGGKFGLYDTPCHIRAMKSTERQQNILASETKIKIDSCLCDACFRHVDRKANCPSYRKKAEAKSLSLAKMQSSMESSEKLGQNEANQKAGEGSGAGTSSQQGSQPGIVQELEQNAGKVQGSCHVQNCASNACHTIRRKWLLKMKKTICKILEITLDQSNAAMTLVPICDGHYEQISHLMVCAMCRRRLPKNHIYYIVNEIPQLERLIQEQGIAMKLGNSTLVVCKLCRYYANLLLKPPDAKSQKAQFIKNYNRRLLQFYERDMEQQLQQQQQEQIVTNPDIIISDGEEDEPLEIVAVNESISLQRRTRQSRKSTDLTIIDASGGTNCSQVGDLDEVTITPAPKLVTAAAVANISGNSSIVLDTDLSFEAPPSAEKRRKNDDGLDMTKALKANPNISMRELFPGEEELGIHINIPFNTASARTPEGWAKVSMTLQYDDATRSLWEDLQKPYGNQSSFLRHLVLLEKYYRNGDLILSPQAKNNAVTYSEAVQNRLRSFDNLPTPPPISVIDKSSIMQQQLGNAPITITPAAKVRTKSSTEPVSLLKSNNPHLIGTGESLANSMKRKLSTDGKAKSTSTSGAAKTDSSTAASKVIKLDDTVVGPSNKATSLVPPELISINAKQNVTITTIPAGSKPSTGQSNQPAQQQSLLQPQQQSLLQPQVQVKKSPGTGGTREIIKLPDQLTEAERRETSKPWRPTLIPITPGSAEAIKAGPLYQTADGRRLPKLVQVMSGGKPYHISINDYNRMCILRREKLLQQQQQLLIQQHHKRLQQQSPPNLTAIKPTNSKPSETPPKMVQIPNQILEQNSLIPITNNNNNNSAKTNGPSSELQQLIKTRKPNSTNSALVPPPLAANAASAFFKNAMGLGAAGTGTKPLSLPNSTSVFSMPAQNQQQQQQQPQPVSSETTPSQLDQLIKLNNFVSQSQLSAFVAAAAAAVSNSAAANTPLLGGTSGGSILMDNSAAQLLSKIPKSLTVIPQQKQRSLSRVSSNEDQSSA